MKSFILFIYRVTLQNFFLALQKKKSLLRSYSQVVFCGFVESFDKSS